MRPSAISNAHAPALLCGSDLTSKRAWTPREARGRGTGLHGYSYPLSLTSTAQTSLFRGAGVTTGVTSMRKPGHPALHGFAENRRHGNLALLPASPPPAYHRDTMRTSRGDRHEGALEVEMQGTSQAQMAG